MCMRTHILCVRAYTKDFFTKVYTLHAFSGTKIYQGGLTELRNNREVDLKENGENGLQWMMKN